jgi:hypothetical protein
MALSAEENELLTRVGPGMPGGEILRRYWHPIGFSAELKRRPKRRRLLGEDLVLFRDERGRSDFFSYTVRTAELRSNSAISRMAACAAVIMAGSSMLKGGFWNAG